MDCGYLLSFYLPRTSVSFACFSLCRGNTFGSVRITVTDVERENEAMEEESGMETGVYMRPVEVYMQRDKRSGALQEHGSLECISSGVERRFARLST